MNTGTDDTSAEKNSTQPSAGQLSEPSDAFEALGNEIRIATIRALADTDRDAGELEAPLQFSDLQTAVGASTSAGFAYHLRKLSDHYVEKTEQGYRLTSAGQRVARAITAGTYTERTDLDPITISGSCPLCQRSTLTARCVDNTLAIECECLDAPIAHLSLPPGSQHRSIDEDLLETFDRYHRSRIALLTDGICTECMSPVTATIDRVPAPRTDASTEDRESEATRAQLHLNCAGCDVEMYSPVVFAVVEHPAVIGFFDTHGIDIRERPLWNLGEEWSETILSEKPWCVRVSVRCDDDRLDLLVGEGMTVHVLDDDVAQPSAASGSS
jgi:hypothetical protein